MIPSNNYSIENVEAYLDVQESGGVRNAPNHLFMINGSVNNVYVSSQNHSFDPLTYLAAIPSERVAQIHIAGHSVYEDIIIDTHDKAPPPSVWNLYQSAIKKVGHTPTLLEWDSKIPSFDEVYNEASKAKKFLKR